MTTIILVCAILAVFTLIQDAGTMFGANWDLRMSEDLEAKYGFLLAVTVVMISGDFFRRKNKSDEVSKADP